MDGDATRTKGVPETEPPIASPVRYLRQFELVEQVKAYHPEANENLLNAGYVFAVAKHGSQKRASGDPYFSHPVAVAGLLADLKLDEHTILAGLLHDTVEDTDATLADIEDLFGMDVCMLVNGLTKLGEIEYTGGATKQAENFQKFILATITDVRVLLVKLADRLHNMRTLHFIKKPEKRERIARETMDIYAPLARRIGLYTIASEMEDLSFAQINPKARDAILEKLANLSEDNSDALERVRRDLYELLQLIGVEGRVQSRRKQPYSIWRKLERKSISFRQVADIFAFRVIIEHEEDCYRVLGASHSQWQCIEERFRDFISVPKPNGYRSLHTTVRATQGNLVDFKSARKICTKPPSMVWLRIGAIKTMLMLLIMNPRARLAWMLLPPCRRLLTCLRKVRTRMSFWSMRSSKCTATMFSRLRPMAALLFWRRARCRLILLMRSTPLLATPVLV